MSFELRTKEDEEILSMPGYDVIDCVTQKFSFPPGCEDSVFGFMVRKNKESVKIITGGEFAYVLVNAGKDITATVYCDWLKNKFGFNNESGFKVAPMINCVLRKRNKNVCPKCGDDIEQHYALGANFCPCALHKTNKETT